jgi:type II secretory pathway pseudopilin PulG
VVNRSDKSYTSQSGFSYLFVLFALVLVGLSMMGANKQWTTMMQREREAELLFRGHQYRRAIASYVESVPGARQYPPRVEDLMKDPRNSKRHLRSAYLDPITNGPFHAVPCKDRIKGVYSPSAAQTLKRDNFPPEYEQFRSTARYREWTFQYEPGLPGASPAAAAAPPVPPNAANPRAPAAGPPALAPIAC